MELDVFSSICQTEVHGYMPDGRTMFENFFEQVELADELGFGTGSTSYTYDRRGLLLTQVTSLAVSEVAKQYTDGFMGTLRGRELRLSSGARLR